MDEPFSALDVLTAETLRTDLLDLWDEGQLPIKAILIVTHNIEEAVLMCDRILVFVDQSRPRGRRDQGAATEAALARRPAFRAIVERIYVEMTAGARPAAKPGEKPAATAQADSWGQSRA